MPHPATPPHVELYTRPFCPYCSGAVALLKKKGVAFREIENANKPDIKPKMVERAGRATFPQIFIGDTHVGGYDDLAALDKAGRLDPMLGLS